MNKLVPFIIILIITAGCTETPVVLPPPIVPAEGKVILLEDLTGVDCPNCPLVAARLEELLKEFEKEVVVVGIHGTQLTAPIEGSKYDFRNEDAILLEEYLKPFSGKPAVAYNRRQFEGENNLSLGGTNNIAIRTEELLLEPQTINIDVTYELNEETREIKIFAGVAALNDMTGDFNITALVTESHIIDAQTDGASASILTDFEHNHVLRDVISNTTGDPLSTELKQGQILSKSWTYTIPKHDELWVLDNLEFVVFVSDHSNNSKEVLQANKFKLE